MKWALLALLLAAGLGLAPQPAHAALTLCNRTSYILYAATSAIQSPKSETQGWTHNTVFIDMGPYLVAMEAPNDDGQAKVHLALARQKYGNKPIK